MTYRVEQQSMQPTLNPGDVVALSRAKTYQRADIVVFTAPPAWAQGPGIQFIKRVIGVGGDTVDVGDDRRVYVNGSVLVEPYLLQNETTAMSAGAPHWVLRHGELFVLGDHRSASADSRTFGPIEESSVAGRAWLRCSPGRAPIH